MACPPNPAPQSGRCGCSHRERTSSNDSPRSRRAEQRGRLGAGPDHVGVGGAGLDLPDPLHAGAQVGREPNRRSLGLGPGPPEVVGPVDPRSPVLAVSADEDPRASLRGCRCRWRRCPPSGTPAYRTPTAPVARRCVRSTGPSSSRPAALPPPSQPPRFVLPDRNISVRCLRGSRPLDHLVRAARSAGLLRSGRPGADGLRAEAASRPDPAVLLGVAGDEPGLQRAGPAGRRRSGDRRIRRSRRASGRRYRISAAGLQRLRDWQAESTPEFPVLKHPVALRLLMGGLSSPEQLRQMLADYRDSLVERRPSWWQYASPWVTDPRSPTRPWSPTGVWPTTTARTRSSPGSPSDSPSEPSTVEPRTPFTHCSPTRSILTP